MAVKLVFLTKSLILGPQSTFQSNDGQKKSDPHTSDTDVASRRLWAYNFTHFLSGALDAGQLTCFVLRSRRPNSSNVGQLWFARQVRGLLWRRRYCDPPLTDYPRQGAGSLPRVRLWLYE